MGVCVWVGGGGAAAGGGCTAVGAADFSVRWEDFGVWMMAERRAVV